ncbi:uncharacterized protein LOC141601143 [Silene latifolia]|uniref:uncharacterized protein LOC141601143 n=1 Tax=Silene latifolia TaxID=37657 RepID=UPI003D78091A
MESPEFSHGIIGVPQSCDAQKTKDMRDIVGIPVIELAELVGEAVPSPGAPMETAEDVDSEIKFWETAVVCYVLGGNPPWELLQGFIDKIWGIHKYDKISFLPNGVFLVRFPSVETQNLVLKQGFPMFDNKPLVVKPWTESCSMQKERVQFVPIWLRLCGLPLKFWGQASLTKIAGLIGKFLKGNTATEEKTRLGYARLLVEVEIGQFFPDHIVFLDEKGVEVRVNVEYEWKPTICNTCKGIGHTTDMCKPKQEPIPRQSRTKPPNVSKVPQKVWRPVKKVVSNPVVAPRQPSPAPYGGVVHHNSSLLTPVSVLQQVKKKRMGEWKQYHILSQMDKIGCWNVRALNSKNKQQDVRKFLAQNNVGLYGLVETKVKLYDFDLVLNNLGSFWQGINNNNFHHGGRVWLIWNPHYFSVTPISVDAQAISAKDVYDNNTGPWSVCGEFNNVLHYNERIGREVTWNDIAAFRECVQYCGLQDITGKGAFFTWNNKQIPSARGFSRIDRFLVNTDWMDCYPDSYARFLPEGLFDHNPSVCYRRPDREKRKPPFRYFNMWSMDAQFSDIVQSVWATDIDGTLMYKVFTKLKLLKAPLKTLNRNRFSDIEKAVGVARLLLEDLQIQMHNSPTDSTILAAEREAAASYNQLCKMQHSYLSQKAKVDWIKFGDDNTRFFHSHIRARQIHNRIMCIKDQYGVMCDTTDTIEHAFLSYYKTLLGSRQATAAVYFPTVRTDPIITDAHVPLLLAPVTDSEIKECIFSISSIKSPGPDGFTSQFYKDTWEVVGDEGGFVKGRSILDNGLICQDLVRLYNRKAASPRCLIKIDLRKAYDSVEWSFLEQMLDAMKFPKQFSNLIMKCVSTPAFSLALNGSLFGFFQGQRGLRQGDPLSPLLFTICMEYLSRILRVAAQQDGFHYHPLCGHIKLNHLLFADDLILFSKGTESAIMWLLRSFSTFYAASDLQLNQEKSEIYFNGMPEAAMANILQVSGFHRGTLPFKYLGVPISSKKLTKHEGLKLTDSIVAKIRGWGAKHLSYAGRLTLVQSVLSTLHSYCASIFMIPNGIMNRIKALCRNYLWGRPKPEGGLGLKKCTDWNIALLGKYVWWLAKKKDHMWVKWVSHVYMKDKHWTEYTAPSDCSWPWKKITLIMKKFKQAYTNDKWLNSDLHYSVKAGYDWLRGVHPQVPWYYLCWNSLNVPKSSFIFWAIQLNRLLTKDRLTRMGMSLDPTCDIFGDWPENHTHLFSECSFVRSCSHILQAKLLISFPANNVVNWFSTDRRYTRLQKRYAGACYVDLLYHVWQVRNEARLSFCVKRPLTLVLQVLDDVQHRFHRLNVSALKQKDSVWLQQVNGL